MKTLKIALFTFVLTFSIQLIGQTAYITKTGKKYHKTSCHYLKNSKIETTIKKAKAIGLSACKICKPIPRNLTTLSKETSKNTKEKDTISLVQCRGKTKAGKRCKRKTKNGRCHEH